MPGAVKDPDRLVQFTKGELRGAGLIDDFNDLSDEGWTGQRDDDTGRHRIPPELPGDLLHLGNLHLPFSTLFFGHIFNLF